MYIVVNTDDGTQVSEYFFTQDEAETEMNRLGESFPRFSVPLAVEVTE